ncbi:LysR family transcriptional regulator [Rhizobium oryziradicis]|uniref:LysR family transcriptional regulator n=1 Tax=Rhizobium oryziradicis TaxID=1867956 RepID=A0A1Q8ZQN6_9HYPH|nr:LysR family transcriptional regulator [Rhizobium oryziradicis]OLP44394.1 LysR family transcriptional regulator [Rhizobium oryziradicis]
MAKDITSWDHFRSFLAVLDEGSLSAAARTLGLTQPTVGRHIEALEAMFGTSLFLRVPQGLLPTDTALAMRAQAEAMAASGATLARIASSGHHAAQGTVRISASEIVAIEILPPILADLQESHPNLEIELSLSDKVEDLLRHQADIAVRMVAPQQGNLLSQRIGAIRLGFHAHTRYLAKHGTPKTLEDLHQHRLIGFDRQLAYIRDILKARPDLARISFAFRCDSNAAQFAAIRAGAGIGMCQTTLAKRHDDLVEVLPTQLNVDLDTYVVMHEDLKHSPRCRVAFDAIVNGLKAYQAE